MMRTTVIAVALLGAACGGDVYTVQVRPAADIGCQGTLQRLRWVEVNVIRQKSDGDLEELVDKADCEAVGPTNRTSELLAPFEAAGVYASGVPADSRTLLRFFAYPGERGCIRSAEIVCGISCPPVREGEIPEEGVTVRFVCDNSVQAHSIFLACGSIEDLSEEYRSRICDPTVVP